MESGAQMRFG